MPVCASPIYRHESGHRHYWERGYYTSRDILEERSSRRAFDRHDDNREQWYYLTGTNYWELPTAAP